jgi:putative ABC transport system permease protein
MIYNYLPFQGNFQGNNEPQVLIDKLRDKYPNYSFKSSQEYISTFIGGSLDQLDSMKNLIVLIVICINALITILMMKTFITKEKGEIAMLKSVGFRNSSIRLWQSARISIVLAAAIILGIILSKFLGPVSKRNLTPAAKMCLKIKASPSIRSFLNSPFSLRSCMWLF